MPTGEFNGLWVRFTPTGPWRIGPDSGDRDLVDRVYHSDTLYSAISSAMARLGMIDEWLDATARALEPAVRFSSCFPFQGETHFVVPPRSLWPPPPSAKVRWKGARFVPLSVVNELVHGRPMAEDGWTVDGASECLVPIGSQAGSQGPFRVSVRSSAAVDRHGSGVELHSSACLEFASLAGLWMVAAFSNDEATERWRDRLQGALQLLADSGFGGERSRGWGHASIEFSTTNPKLLPSTDVTGETAWWMLSLFHPSSGDSVDWQRGNYSLITRGGRIEKPTRMVSEGSVIVAGTEPRGAAPNVAPEDFPHPVYRAGFALAIPIPWRQPSA